MSANPHKQQIPPPRCAPVGRGGVGVEAIAAGAGPWRAGVMGDPQVTDELDQHAESYRAHCESGAPVEGVSAAAEL